LGALGAVDFLAVVFFGLGVAAYARGGTAHGREGSTIQIILSIARKQIRIRTFLAFFSLTTLAFFSVAAFGFLAVAAYGVEQQRKFSR
jgi:hypothetical protein